ncbi:SDR family NAD(P)-dependent oxidoreductase [Pollutimonas sp. M17]|uniref:SDR family NAD(P)-dependent oxidoreductase n=1 Tax=Pollutimonas sp. M17 TaxID=2962065 RepID=UPI0021F47488|nr:SDR family NAD(P)-dependent oxidoreductase [Pollutimonas sp. M17]UYO93283.1 SDR family oxidoreductase [Pollutimonas sp. M17]HWK72291.1 SDR family NAD(P)-dependent oxidoreductase [Burkholderiaceae bacterium]
MTVRNNYDFSGRHAVITGGAAGIGLAIAARLTEGGAGVTLWDRDPQALAKAQADLGSQSIRIEQVDVGDEASVQSAADATVKAAGAVDILVNSAGITGPNTSVWEYPPAEWDRVMRVNLRGPFLCCRAIVPHMRANDYGRIVNIASVAGKEGNPNASAYSASKAAVIALTKSLGKELAQTGITVNCITPAAVRTAIFDQMTQEHIDYMLSKIPMNRFGKTEEIAALVAWLCSEDCSFSTGATFDISGGRATY